MDNLIRSSEEYKKERDMVVTISTLTAVIIIAAGIFIPLAIKYASMFIPVAFSWIADLFKVRNPTGVVPA